MKGWFKPLFAYKKYLLAEKILKDCCGSYLTLKSEGDEEHLLTEHQYLEYFVASNFLREQAPYSTSPKVIEAIDLLESNGHITTKRHSNLFKFSIKCTKSGATAFREGFYKKKVFIFWRNLVATIGGSSLLVWLLNQLPKWLNR